LRGSLYAALVEQAVAAKRLIKRTSWASRTVSTMRALKARIRG
jgi:hypothetical protein